jgi:uncharacterized protein YraI
MSRLNRKVFLCVFCLIWLSVTPVAKSQSSDAASGISGNTIAIVNLRNGPGTNFDVVATLENRTRLTFIGRNASSTWLQARVDGSSAVGWLSYTFANVEGSVLQLPIINNAAPVPVPSARSEEQASRPEAPARLPASAPSEVVPRISSTARQIFLVGQRLGNRPDVFSKVGDSITASNLFLDPIGHGGLILHDYEYLRPVVEYFSHTSAGDHNSFANTSLAARNGWTTFDVLNPGNAPASCDRNEMPLVCEYRLTRPAVALIMFGTNDAVSVDSAAFHSNLETIIHITVDMGVIPVLSTIPDQFGTAGSSRVGELNDIIRLVAATYRIPLWDYWLAMQSLPNNGISSDGVHPSVDPGTTEAAIFTPDGLRYGYNMRNLTALMVLDAVWRGALY